MAVITVFKRGGFDVINKERFYTFTGELRAVADDVPDLGLVSDHISVILPEVSVQDISGEKIIMVVNGLVDLPSRTDKVLNDYAAKLGQVVRKFFPKIAVEVFISPLQTFHFIPRG